MTASNSIRLKTLLAGAMAALAFSLPVAAAEINGVKIEDTAKVANKDLKLSNYGMRTKFIVKVYAVGLYAVEKAKSADELLKMDGPRRIKLVMMRDISSEDFGDAFMAGLNANSDAAEKAKIVGQISKYGEMFASLPGLKKGQVLHLDYIPGAGTQCEIDGKKIGDVAPDAAFFNAILKIWLGPKPVDSSLKTALLSNR